MTFNQIALKMFKSNFRRYLVFFLCSTFNIMIFFSYSTIFTNKKFMTSSQVNSSISSMIILPSIVITLFSIFFMIYSHGSFNKYRKSEFGIFLVLGMTNNDIRKIIWIENSIIALLSLVIGLISGSIISKIVYYIINNVIGIIGVAFTLTFDSFLYTITLFVSIYIVMILFTMIATLKYEIINLLKEQRREDRSVIINPIFTCIGLIIIIYSVIYMMKKYNSVNSSVMVISMVLCFVGTYLLISNMGSIIASSSRFFKNIYCRNMLFNTNLKYSFAKSKNILFVITCLVSITIFFSSLCALFMSESRIMATEYNPYHIAYSELDGINKISEKSLNSIIKDGETPLTLRKNVEFIEEPQISIFSDNELNKTFACNFHVKDGHFITLFQIIKDDGYSHNTSQMKNLDIKSNNKTSTYIFQGEYTKVLFNNLNMLSDGFCVILNNNDYLHIKKNIDSNQIGYIKLFDFEDWKKTKGIADKLSAELKIYNKGNISGFEIRSRIGDYTTSNQSSSFLLFLLSFISILFFLASNIMLHFKLLTEFQNEKVKYKKLYKIGITKKEVEKTITKELKILFFLPVLFGIAIGTFYIYYMSLSNGKEITAVEFSLSIGVIYIFMQIILYCIYKKLYINKLFNF